MRPSNTKTSKLDKDFILYIDKYIVVVDKPHGLMVEPDRHGYPNVVEEVQKRLPLHSLKIKKGLGVTYRLDRPVGGVLVFALTKKALVSINSQIENRSISKTYEALVEGSVAEENGTWENHLSRSENQKKAVVTDSPSATSKPALAHWKKLEEYENITRISIDLKTGRFHQIRAQAAHWGHPIVGDHTYGARPSKEQSQIALIAKNYTLEHPISGQPMTFTSKMNFEPFL